MSDAGPPGPEGDAARQSPKERWSAYDDLGRADKAGYWVAAVLVTLAGLGVALLIYVVVRTAVNALVGE